MPDPKARGPASGAGLTRTDHVAAISETEFLALPIERRLEVLPYLQPSRRRNLILECEDARQLIEAMQAQDLFLTVKEIGLDDAAGIVALMHPEQFRACLDFDIWSRDEITTESAWRWLTVLADAGFDPLMQKFMAIDFEVTVTLLTAHCKVFIVKDDFDPDEGTPPGSVTVDGVYHVIIEGDDDRRALIREIMQDLFQRDHDMYMRLLSAVRDGMSTQVQEEAFRWRTARMSDLGFPDYVESLKIYARSEKRRERAPHAARAGVDVPPSFAIVRHDGPSAIPLELLAKLNAGDAGTVALGAAHLVNWLVVADRIDPGDVEQVRALMEKARGYVAIGLAEHGDDPAKALAGTPMIELFRAGFTKALDLAERAKKIVAEHPLVAGDRKALRLDEASRETVVALLQPRPMLYLGAVKPGAVGYGHFGSLQDLSTVSGFLDRIDASAEIFGTILKIFKRDLGALDLKGCNVVSRDDLAVCRLFNTALCRKLLHGDYALAPIAAADLGRLHGMLFVVEGASVDLGPDAVDAARTIADLVEDRRPDLRRPAMQFVNGCLEDLKEGFGHIDPAAPLQPAFIGALLVRG